MNPWLLCSWVWGGEDTHLPTFPTSPVWVICHMEKKCQSLGIYRFLRFLQSQDPSPALDSCVTWDKVLLLSGS